VWQAVSEIELQPTEMYGLPLNKKSYFSSFVAIVKEISHCMTERGRIGRKRGMKRRKR
jgi:hypothetical protein